MKCNFKFLWRSKKLSIRRINDITFPIKKQFFFLDAAKRNITRNYFAGFAHFEMSLLKIIFLPDGSENKALTTILKKKCTWHVPNL